MFKIILFLYLFSGFLNAGLEDMEDYIKNNDINSIKNTLNQQEDFIKNPKDYLLNLVIKNKKKYFLSLVARHGRPDVINFLNEYNISIFDNYNYSYSRYGDSCDSILEDTIANDNSDLFLAIIDSLDLKNSQNILNKLIDEIIKIGGFRKEIICDILSSKINLFEECIMQKIINAGAYNEYLADMHKKYMQRLEQKELNNYTINKICELEKIISKMQADVKSLTPHERIIY